LVNKEKWELAFISIQGPSLHSFSTPLIISIQGPSLHIFSAPLATPFC